jgi:hypothetical protein
MFNYENEYMEYGPQTESYEADQYESEWEWTGEDEVFNEGELMELAGELLNVDSEEELEYFLGKLVKKAARKVKRAVRSPIGRAVGGFLKNAAKRALPLAGAAAGGFLGGPLGAQIGSGLASAAGGRFGLEMEALEAEDQEFEGAKTFVRMAGDAVKSAVSAPASIDPVEVAKSSVTAAAQKHAPGLSGGKAKRQPTNRSGRWVRQGRNIVIENACCRNCQ